MTNAEPTQAPAECAVQAPPQPRIDQRILKSPSALAQRTFFYVQECGHLQAQPGHHTSRQNLQSFLLAIVLHGKGYLHYQGQDFQLTQGDCFFLDCREPHDYHCDDDDPWELTWVHFNGCTSEGYYRLFTAQTPPIFHPVSVGKLTSLVQEIIRLNTESFADTEILTSQQLVNLLTALLSVNSISEGVDSALQSKLRTVLSYIDANFTSDISLDALAQRFFISKYYLTREFKRSYGETIFQHIISLRINYAKRLLRFTDKSVEEISELCGFNDQSYFSKQFKKAENVTCLAFRRRWRD